jgi:hypothetical protein
MRLPERLTEHVVHDLADLAAKGRGANKGHPGNRHDGAPRGKPSGRASRVQQAWNLLAGL